MNVRLKHVLLQYTIKITLIVWIFKSISLHYLWELQFIDLWSPQIGLAVRRYMKKATVQNTDEMHLTDLEQPLLIAVCKSNQFNYTLGEQLGMSIPLSWSETYKFFFKKVCLRNKIMVSVIPYCFRLFDATILPEEKLLVLKDGLSYVFVVISIVRT